MQSIPDAGSASDADEVQPLRDRDATALEDPSDDPAQTEWEQSESRGGAAPENSPDEGTATGRDPDEIPAADDEIPFEDLPASETQPETQGADPVIADLGEEGEGDLAPEDA